MIVLDSQMLEAYDDRVWRILDSLPPLPFASERWLREKPAKRFVWDLLYGDLLEGPSRKVLDVGGGFSSLTLPLLAHDYTLVDIMAHDDPSSLKGQSYWRDCDWANLDVSECDVVIANDIFPNVDQRLEAFLDKFVPISKEVRLSLTFYNEPHYYKVRRVDCDEVFWTLMWDGSRTERALRKYEDRIHGFTPSAFYTKDSVFSNGRSVAVLTIRGYR